MWSAHCQVKFRVLQCELARPVPHCFTIISSQRIESEEIQKAMEHFLGMTRDHQRDEPFLTIMSALWSISCFQLCGCEHTEQCIFLGRTWREVGDHTIISSSFCRWHEEFDSLLTKASSVAGSAFFRGTKEIDVVATRRQLEIDWAVAPLPMIR